MAQYRIAADLVALSKINELLEIKRRRENEAARIALVMRTPSLTLEQRYRVLKTIMILESHGLETVEAIEVFTEIMKVFANNEEEEEDE